MNLHQVVYENADGEKRRSFAGSADAASKLATDLKKTGVAVAKPERSAIEVPTDKAGLIDWLNEHATAVEE